MERIPVPNGMAHLSPWTLEQLAEGSLPSEERRMASQHVQACGRCAAELDSVQDLFSALADLPRFAPAAGFNDAVMASVSIAPRASLVPAWLARWLPATGRGWTMLVSAIAAPALPLILLVLWLLTKPLVSVETLWIWGGGKVSNAAQAGWTAAVDLGLESGAFAIANSALQSAAAVSPALVAAVITVFAIAIPLSAWSLVRFARSPLGQSNYAN